jgi:hypothetical protein
MDSVARKRTVTTSLSHVRRIALRRGTWCVSLQPRQRRLSTWPLDPSTDLDRHGVKSLTDGARQRMESDAADIY